MMFDEPTANLDSETASIFYRCINQMKKSHSIVMATHDIAGMAMADEVVFLDRGKLICQGAHDELLKNSDHYKRFIAATNDVLI